MTCPLATLDTPATDDPVAAVLTFAAGAVVGLGATVLMGLAMKESMRRQDSKECER